jgi:hypothetical protein
LKSPAWFGSCVEPGPDAIPGWVWLAQVDANALTVAMSSNSSFKMFSASLPIHVFWATVVWLHVGGYFVSFALSFGQFTDDVS